MPMPLREAFGFRLHSGVMEGSQGPTAEQVFDVDSKLAFGDQGGTADGWRTNEYKRPFGLEQPQGQLETMKLNRNNAGFTLIELMIVVAIIAIIASVAIPKLMAARLSANESAAISTLRSLSSAQAQLQSSSAIDSDADGGGEYGFFGELSGAFPLRISGVPAGGVTPPAAGVVGTDELTPAVLSSAFGGVQADAAGDGVVVRSGYVFKIFLPLAGATALPQGELTTGGADPANFPDANNTEILWGCYAWPLTVGQTGNRAFFINQEGDLLQNLNRAAALSYSGFGAGSVEPLGAAALATLPAGLGMSSQLGVGARAPSNDGFTWTVVQ